VLLRRGAHRRATVRGDFASGDSETPPNSGLFPHPTLVNAPFDAGRSFGFGIGFALRGCGGILIIRRITRSVPASVTMSHPAAKLRTWR
jgi:hypothetical protein